MSSRPPAIEVERLNKTFRVPEQRVHTLKERAQHPFRKTRYDELRVLDDVSFRVLEGEFSEFSAATDPGRAPS